MDQYWFKWVFLGGKMRDGGISPKNAGMGVIGGWGYFKPGGHYVCTVVCSYLIVIINVGCFADSI